MAFRRWQLGVLAVAAVVLAWRVVPGHPTVAIAGIVALAGVAAAGILHARATRIQSELETLVHRLFAAGERERAAVEAERRGYLGRMRTVQLLIAEQQRALAEIAQELDRAPSHRVPSDHLLDAPAHGDAGEVEVAEPVRVAATA